jgi:enoyl-CoA hydratase/carnithine racemase
MRTVLAAEALALGLVDRVVPDPRAAALDLAAQIASLDPGAVTRVKRIVRDGAGLLSSLRQERAGNRDWSGSVPPTTRDV